MRRFSIGTGLVVLLASFAVSAAVAQAAPEWWVSGKVIAKKEAIAGAPVVTQTIKFSNSKLTVACTVVKVIGGAIEPGNKDNLESLAFSGCSVPSNSNCAVSAIETEPLGFPLQGEKGNIKLNFRPTTGSTIAVFTVTKVGGTCTEAGTHKITSGPKSGMVCNYPSVETESLEHELAFGEGSGSELEMDGLKASMIGTYKFALASHSEWSAR
jgi:hypothetical protein